MVAGNAELAAGETGQLLKAVNDVELKKLSEGDHKNFITLNNKLPNDARHNTETKEISQQWEQFKSLSDNFCILAKKVRLATQPIYQHYCPMEIAFWLRRQMIIMNPYFGSQMHDCGKLTETLK